MPGKKEGSMGLYFFWIFKREEISKTLKFKALEFDRKSKYILGEASRGRAAQ
jgi:hypothetical protein